MNKIVFALTLLAAGSAFADGDTVKALNFEYQSRGAGPRFSAEAGKAMFEREGVVEGEKRSCATCHTTDLRAEGKQANTGKVIKPLAPSVNTERLTRPHEVEKWFHRNCKWTYGRTCTPQEKGDFLAYISSL